MKKLRIVALLGVLAAVLVFNLALPPVAAAAMASPTPCTDMWAGCMAGGGGSGFCEGMWCGCMYSQYGYIC